MTELPELLVRHRDALVRFFAGHAAYLRRFEAAEDLAQGVHLQAIRHQDRFEYRGEKPFLAWLLALARQHLADRIAYWKALKRDAGPMLRITIGGGVDPSASATGPVTRASRREQLHLATLAMDGLPPRDRALGGMMSAGAGIDTIADRLRVSRAAAQRARLRAMDRFRKVYALVQERRDARP